jgi:hypothetical protein
MRYTLKLRVSYLGLIAVKWDDGHMEDWLFLVCGFSLHFDLVLICFGLEGLAEFSFISA